MTNRIAWTIESMKERIVYLKENIERNEKDIKEAQIRITSWNAEIEQTTLMIKKLEEIND